MYHVCRWKPVVFLQKIRMFVFQVLVKSSITEILVRAKTFVPSWGNIIILTFNFVFIYHTFFSRGWTSQKWCSHLRVNIFPVFAAEVYHLIGVNHLTLVFPEYFFHFWPYLTFWSFLVSLSIASHRWCLLLTLFLNLNIVTTNTFPL